MSRPVSFWNFTQTKNKVIPELLKYRGEGLGLSAIQIGIALQVFILKLNNSKWIEVINPTVLDMYSQIISKQEGCLSIPNVRVDIERFNYVEATFVNIKGKKEKLVLQGMEAIAFQHECDHLDGILIIDREVV